MIRNTSIKCVSFTLVAASVLGACTKQPPGEPLAAVSLNPQQAEGLRRINEAGTTAFGGRTWQYEFGAGCVLRVRPAFEGRKEPSHDYVLVGYNVNVVPYADNGFGVKAYDSHKGGSVDLFDSASNNDAVSFVHSVDDLIAPCRR